MKRVFDIRLGQKLHHSNEFLFISTNAPKFPLFYPMPVVNPIGATIGPIHPVFSLSRLGQEHLSEVKKNFYPAVGFVVYMVESKS